MGCPAALTVSTTASCLPDPESLLARFSPRVLAATIDRAVRHWSGAAQANYPDTTVFKADQADMRKATPLLEETPSVDQHPQLVTFSLVHVVRAWRSAEAAPTGNSHATTRRQQSGHK